MLYRIAIGSFNRDRQITRRAIFCRHGETGPLRISARREDLHPGHRDSIRGRGPCPSDKSDRNGCATAGDSGWMARTECPRRIIGLAVLLAWTGMHWQET